MTEKIEVTQTEPEDVDTLFEGLPEGQRLELKARSEAWIRSEIVDTQTRLAIQSKVAENSDASEAAWAAMLAQEQKDRKFAAKHGRRARGEMVREHQRVWGRLPNSSWRPSSAEGPSRDTGRLDASFERSRGGK